MSPVLFSKRKAYKSQNSLIQVKKNKSPLGLVRTHSNLLPLSSSRLHRQLQLSMRSQVNLGADKHAISPAYVFGGQHVPIVVRLAESLWAQGLGGTNSETSNRSSFLSGPELPSKDQLSRALTLLHIDERC